MTPYQKEEVSRIDAEIEKLKREKERALKTICFACDTEVEELFEPELEEDVPATSYKGRCRACLDDWREMWLKGDHSVLLKGDTI